MPLQGEAKTNYMREYMRKKRSNGSLMLDPSLDQSIKGLKAVNDRLEGVIETMKRKKKIRKPSGKSQEKVSQKLETINIPQDVKTEEKPLLSTKAALYGCPKCFGTGLITADKAGIFARYCDCEIGQRKLAEKKRIFDK